MRQEIRNIYFEEQLPREIELLELEGRRRREEKFRSQGGPLVAGKRIVKVTLNECEEEGGEREGITLEQDQATEQEMNPEQDKAPEQGEHALEEQDTSSGDQEPEVYPPVFSDDVTGMSVKPSKTEEKHTVTMTQQYSNNMTSLSKVGSESHHRLSVPSRTTWQSSSSVSSYRRRSTFSRMTSTSALEGEKEEEDEMIEEEEKPQKTPAEIMECVRHVYHRMPQREERHPVKNLFLRNLLPRNMPHLPAPKPPPSQIQEEVKERFEAILQRFQQKGLQEKKPILDFLEEEDDQDEIDFTDRKWKPYQILLEETRDSFLKSKRPPLNAPSRLMSRQETVHALSPIVRKVSDPRLSFLKNKIINSDDNDSDSMSFIFSRSQSQATDRTGSKSHGTKVHWSPMEKV